jgi:hypothetical protein
VWPFLCSAIGILSSDFGVTAEGLVSNLEDIGFTDDVGDPIATQFFNQIDRLQQLAIFSATEREGIERPSLNALLPVGRTAEQLDDRDKVYGILSLVELQIIKLIGPDYESTVEDVFINFAKAVIIATGSLDILCHSRSDPAKPKQFPAWVPDWREKQMVGQEMSIKVPYQTSRDHKVSIRFEGGTLFVQGFIFDKVDGLGHTEEIANGIIHDVVPPRHEASAYNSEIAIREVLWCGLVANRDGSENVVPESYAGLLDIPWEESNTETDPLHFSVEMFTDFRKANRALSIGGREFQAHFPSHHDTDISQPTEWIEGAVLRVSNVAMGRRLMTTEKGYIGMGVNKARQGVIAFGSSVPLILRPDEHGDWYTYVGEAYIHGIMKGEAIDLLDEGKYKVREFSIL